jgi:LacI family transcriptional regulator
MKAKYTIEDIARLAEVSRGTVSRVLNNHPSVSSATRARVQDIIRELDYSPNFSARHMRTETSHMVGFVTDEVTMTPFAVDVIRGAQETLQQYGKVMLMMNAGYDAETTQASVEVMAERRVEGIVYATMFHREVRLLAEMARIPIVLVNCFTADRSLPSVVPDEVSGGYNAARALLVKGHTRIAFINLGLERDSTIPPLPASEGRLAGYKKALAEFGVPYDQTLVRYNDQRMETNYRITRELMHLPDPPTAIFCGNDRTAMGCYNGLMSLGLKIPDDVAVIGFDNQTVICDGLFPTLTTIQLPHYQMGQWAVEYLLASRGGPLAPVQHQIACDLVDRQSA